MEKFIIIILIILIFSVIIEDIFVNNLNNSENFSPLQEFNIFGEITQIKPQIKSENINNDSFDPRNINTLTFKNGQYTNSKRTNPIPQLNCVGGNACHMSSSIDSIQCTNLGINDKDEVQWKCNAELPDGLTIGNSNVNCEGYSDNKDKLKLVNSCGLEYTLNNTKRWKYHYEYSHDEFGFWIWSLSLVILVIFICNFFILPRPFYREPLYNNPYLTPYYNGYYAPPVIMAPRYQSSYLYSDSPTMFETSSTFGTTITR